MKQHNQYGFVPGQMESQLTPPTEPWGSVTGGESLDEPAGFIMDKRRGLYRPVGSVSFDEAVAWVRTAIARACSNQARDLLVDTTALTGFPSPDTFQRFLAAVEWADEARGRLRLAMVARAEMIDPQKFGVTVATNRGLRSNVFTTEAEARAWLDADQRLGP